MLEIGRGDHRLAAGAQDFHQRLASVAVKNHHNGALDPYAHFQEEITIEQALAAPAVCSPLHLFDCCPQTDGAAAVLLAPADRAHELPNRPDTQFGMASGSKIFTALAVLSLVEDGTLDLDESVRRWLGGDLQQVDDAVTLRHLLSHTSGVGEYLDDDADADTYILPGSMHTYRTPEDFVPLLDVPMLGSPGAEFAYSNGGFVLLGLSYGQAAGSVTANFGSKYRYTGAALTSDLAWLIGAAFAPLVALGLSAHFGLAFIGVYLLSGAICTMAALGVNRLLNLRS